MITCFRPLSLGRVVVSLALLGGIAAVGMTQGQPGTAMGPVGATPKDTSPTLQTPAPTLQLPENLNQIKAQAEARRARLAEWEANAKLELRALGKVGDVPLALIDALGEPMFVMNGSGIMGRRVSQIDPSAAQITITDRQGQTRVLKLENPESVEFPAVSPERFLTNEAQARRTERMRFGNQVPFELAQAWPKINREGKVAILMNYLMTGEVVQIVSEPEGYGISVSMGFLFQDQLAAIKRERRDRFIASLTPEQKVEFGSGLAKAIRLADPPEKKEQQMAEAKQAEVRHSQFLANLTPAQKALYDEWVPAAPSASPQGKVR